jgi:hypothetical protein
MKFFYSILVICGCFLITSCDYVVIPRATVNANLGDTASCPTPTFPILTTHVKKILMEDFTGHTCGNCPLAAISIHQVDSIYPGRIIALANHSGDLSAPEPGLGGFPGAYASDFRTTVGYTYSTFFAPYLWPLGMINRRDYNAGTLTHLKFYPYLSYVDTIIGHPSTMDLQIINNYNSSTRKLCTSIRTTFLTPAIGTYKLVALITQDSIIDWQYNGTVHDPTYRFDNMLRDAITPSGAWGETLVSGTITAGTINTQKFAYTIPSMYSYKNPTTGTISPGIPCNVNECYIVAFVYNTTTYEVIQSERVKVN